MIHTIDPFTQAHPTWLGLDESGHRRKVSKVVDQYLNAGEFRCGPHGELPST